MQSSNAGEIEVRGNGAVGLAGEVVLLGDAVVFAPSMVMPLVDVLAC